MKSKTEFHRQSKAFLERVWKFHEQAEASAEYVSLNRNTITAEMFMV